MKKITLYQDTGYEVVNWYGQYLVCVGATSYRELRIAWSYAVIVVVHSRRYCAFTEATYTLVSSVHPQLPAPRSHCTSTTTRRLSLTAADYYYSNHTVTKRDISKTHSTPLYPLQTCRALL